MKKIAMVSSVCMLVLLLGVSVQAGPRVNPGTFELGADFGAKFWMEKFIGGAEGAPGNKLMAVGQGFVFQNAELESVCEADPDDYLTTYTGARLTLNSRGPWLDRGMLKATNITAINCSTKVDDELSFTLTFGGTFDNIDGYYFCVVASYSGTPVVKYDENDVPTFQGDREFESITITISDTEIDDCLAPCEEVSCPGE